MYDKKFISVTPHALYPLPPVTNCHTFSDSFPLERDVLYGRSLTVDTNTLAFKFVASWKLLLFCVSCIFDDLEQHSLSNIKSHLVIVIVIIISKFLERYFKAKRARAPAYSRALRRIKCGFSRRVVKRNSGPIFRIPGVDRVAVRVGVVQMERVNDQMGR